MEVWRFISIMFYLFKPSLGAPYPWLDRYHDPKSYTTQMTPYINGTWTKVASRDNTPDYRHDEALYTIFDRTFPKELERPYRMSPPWRQTRDYKGEYWKWVDVQTGCVCSTVYRHHTLLAAGAVITTRHILTTATPTLLILKSYGHLRTLYGILGGWFDTNADSFNASMYFTPARIHIHPKYVHAHEVNISHPIPAMYDLSVWAATHTFYWSTKTVVIVCRRGSSHRSYYSSSIPRVFDLSIVIGFQFMKSYHRRPLPWFRYIIKTDKHVWPCPKTEWQWFHCIAGEYWGRFGFDSGGGMHSAYLDNAWRADGYIGMCSFSMKLRAKQTVHYFTVIDTYPVLDFMYDAFLGLTDYTYLDGRFENTKWAAPIPYWDETIDTHYDWGEEVYRELGFLPKYRR